MHEVSLVADLLEQATLRASGRPVRRIRVRYATSIPEAALQQAFRMLSAEGALAGASLDAEPFDVRLACACGFEGVLGHDDLIGGSVAVCPSCGDVSTQARTAELELLEVQTTG